MTQIEFMDDEADIIVKETKLRDEECMSHAQGQLFIFAGIISLCLAVYISLLCWRKKKRSTSFRMNKASFKRGTRNRLKF